MYGLSLAFNTAHVHQHTNNEHTKNGFADGLVVGAL
jgi:hypothetical protein